MTIRDTAEIIERIDTAYPNYWGNRDRGEIAKLWAGYFETAPYRCVSKAVDEYIKINRTPPTIADIYEAGAMIYREETDKALIDKL